MPVPVKCYHKAKRYIQILNLQNAYIRSEELVESEHSNRGLLSHNTL